MVSSEAPRGRPGRRSSTAAAANALIDRQRLEDTMPSLTLHRKFDAAALTALALALTIALAACGGGDGAM